MMYEIQDAWGEPNVPPHPKAVKATVVHTDVRFTDDEDFMFKRRAKNILKKPNEHWRDKGTNFRTLPKYRDQANCIARDLTVEGWVIEINTLEELNELATQQFGIKVYVDKQKSDLPLIVLNGDD